MVRKLYKQYAHPLVRVVCGLPISWRSSFATTKHGVTLLTVAWSSCSRFIALGLRESTEVLDAVTLEQLHNFAHSELPSVDGWLGFSPDGHSLTRINSDNKGCITWDLKTGGRISAVSSALITSSLFRVSSIYSMDGNKIAIAGYSGSGKSSFATISTYSLISGTRIYSHRLPEGQTITPIWAHGEFLRLATVGSGFITVWEIGSTSEHTLAEIESLPAPDEVFLEDHTLFLPTLSRLAFILRGAVLIWDTRDSKFLLNFLGGDSFRGLSFSSDGHFFACGAEKGQEVHLWKESPTGYVLHQKLVPGPTDLLIVPFLSPDGESIILSKDYHETQLWRTTDPINPPSSVLSQPAKQTSFVLAFSPDKSLIATGRLGENIATIVDIKSGDPWLIVDTGTKICGLGVTGSTFVVVGEGKIITWNLPAGGCVLNARANIHDSVRTIRFNPPSPSPGEVLSASISPDSSLFVITPGTYGAFDIYNSSTGKHVVPEDCAGRTSPGFNPWFTRDGREIRYLIHHMDGVISLGQKIIRSEWFNVIWLESVGYGDGPPGGYPWLSFYGHEVTDDRWILDSRKKRVMWLPYHLRASVKYRIWDGQFLTLFDPGLLEPVVIELCE